MSDHAPAPAMALNRDLALQAVAEGTKQYFEARRARTGAFVLRHFSVAGTLRLHRAALGWDIARAPLNLFLAVPQICVRLLATLARQMGARRFASRLPASLLLDTDVAQEIIWLVHTELLELPTVQPHRIFLRDAMAEAILATPHVGAAMQEALARAGNTADDAAFRDRLRRAMTEYTVSRAAAAEITTGLVSLGAGAVAVNKITPGAVTLGPALAALMAQQTAVAHFPLGAWLGRIWYRSFPATAPALLVVVTTGGLMLAAATLAAFAGVISDPIQAALGLHRWRLLRLVNALERQVTDPSARGFAVHDHYVARLMDLFDLIGSAVRLTR